MEKALLISSLFLLIVSLIKCVFASRKSASEMYLCLSLLSLFIISIVLYLFISGAMVNAIHFYKTGGIAAYVFIASSFLHIQKSINSKGFKFFDLLYFIPALLYIIDFSSFFMLDGESKRAWYADDIRPNAFDSLKSGYLLSTKNHYIIHSIFGSVVAFFQIVLITQSLRIGGRNFYNRNRARIHWFYIWSFLLFSACFPDYIAYLKGSPITVFSVWFLSPGFLMNYVYPLSLLISPEILYGVNTFDIHSDHMEQGNAITADASLQTISKGISAKKSNSIENSINLASNFKSNFDIAKKHSKPEDEKKVYFKVENAEEIKSILDTFMKESLAFLDIEYSINHLAKDCGYSVRQLSSLLNSYCRISSKDYINTFRIQYFIDKFKNDPSSGKITLEGLAKECGFANRYTFTHAFKKLTNRTPSEYFD